METREAAFWSPPFPRYLFARGKTFFGPPAWWYLPAIWLSMGGAIQTEWWDVGATGPRYRMRNWASCRRDQRNERSVWEIDGHESDSIHLFNGGSQWSIEDVFPTQSRFSGSSIRCCRRSEFANDGQQPFSHRRHSFDSCRPRFYAPGFPRCVNLSRGLLLFDVVLLLCCCCCCCFIVVIIIALLLLFLLLYWLRHFEDDFGSCVGATISQLQKNWNGSENAENVSGRVTGCHPMPDCLEFGGSVHWFMQIQGMAKPFASIW